jgi:pimeloyl-ACP methyl ester carboxylesterase
MANRNKRSMTLDLSKEKGREILYQLVAKSDVFVHNFRMETVRKLRLGYATLSRYNPRQIYGGCSGWGPKRADKDAPAFDFAVTKPGLVLVPGLLCDALLWEAQVKAIAGVAECWIADHARSDTMAGVAADVLREAPFERFALAGLSMGGYVALEILRQAPQRVSKLALLDTSARVDTPEQIAKRKDLISLARRGRFIEVANLFLPLFLHRARLTDEELVATVKRMAKNTGREVFIRQERAIMSRADSLPLLPTIACPTLVLCGRQDALTPLERHEEMASAIPGARLCVIEDCGHLSTLERPAEVSTALKRWLSAE